MSNLRVLISGSGIAGSVFAFWLLRAFPDADVTIVERDSALRLTGASVDIRSSAVDIIKWMGMEEEIRRHSTNEEGMQAVDRDGKPIATLKATGNAEVQGLTSEYEIFRGELAKIFITPVLEKVKLLYDEFVESFEQRVHDKKVVVTFARSKRIETYDLLVAADGVYSKIRGIMLNTSPLDHLHDEGVHLAYFTIKRDLLEGSKFAKGVNATGGRAIYLRPDSDPAGQTRAMLMVVSTKADTEKKKKLNQALREGNETYMTMMEEMYHGVGWLEKEVLKGMRDSDDFYCSRIAQIKPPQLHSGRVVLLGDAGYATPGMATSLAIIGGYFLAGEFLSHPSNVEMALERYDKLMLPFAQSSQGSMSGAMQLLNPQTQWGITIRNSLMSLVTWTRLDRLAVATSSMLGFTEKKFALPEYQWPAKQENIAS